MKSLPLLIFSILSLLGIVSYTISPNPTKSTQQLDPISTFIKKPGTAVLQFNSTWNKQNEYKWVPIKGVRYLEVDIDKNTYCRSKYKLRSLPTIIVYKNGKEINRYEADIMMKLNIKQQELLTNIK
jgi:hypothetical protein